MNSHGHSRGHSGVLRRTSSLINMKILCFVLMLGACLLTELGVRDANAEERPLKAKYRMELVSVFDGEPREAMLVIVFPGGGFAFKSVDALKRFLPSLPKNSTLEWAPSCH